MFFDGSSGSSRTGADSDTFISPTYDDELEGSESSADSEWQQTGIVISLSMHLSCAPGLDDFEELGGVGDKLR